MEVSLADMTRDWASVVFDRLVRAFSVVCSIEAIACSITDAGTPIERTRIDQLFAHCVRNDTNL